MSARGDLTWGLVAVIEEPRSPMAGNEATQVWAVARSCHHERDPGTRADAGDQRPRPPGGGWRQRHSGPARVRENAKLMMDAHLKERAERQPLAALQDPAGASQGTYPAGIPLIQEVGNVARLGQSSSPTLTQTRAEEGRGVDVRASRRNMKPLRWTSNKTSQRLKSKRMGTCECVTQLTTPALGLI